MALRVLANHILAEARSRAGKELPTSAAEQAARLETIADRFEKAGRIEFSIEGLIHSLAGEGEVRVTGPLDFSVEDMAVATVALELLSGRLAADYDSHAERIKMLAQTVSRATEQQGPFC